VVMYRVALSPSDRRRALRGPHASGWRLSIILTSAS